ncbi:hypothetical protein [uncultured Acinetobacter sp.]|uniref:hypothetical protein n=1 Tax=uncultured Acinetobacter sp. TaxID=165433 RepID=UPI0025DD3D8A|nr:hypothetical protein [uncultured Acinetobacter sp.]
MYALAQFPSQGDLIKFAYDALGIIPSKSEQILDLKIENKSLQRNLQRFAKEQGSNFLENFDQHISALHIAIADLLPSWHLQYTILNTFKDLFQCYVGAVLEDHTYLNKQGSFEFILQTTILQRLPISIIKYKEVYIDFFKDTYAPQDFYWFLESEEQTPLSYIMQWIYKSENLPYKNFHQLDVNILEVSDYEEQDKDLENTKNWLNNKSLPAFNDLKAVFERAFESHHVPQKRRENYLFFLLIARFCNYCIKQIKKNYGDSILQSISIKLKAYLEAIYKDFHLFYNHEKKSIIAKKKEDTTYDHSIPESKKNGDVIINFAGFELFSMNCLQSGKDLALHVQRVGHTNDLPDFDDSFPANFNLITLKDCFNYLQSKANPKDFLANIENYHHGYFEVLNKKMDFDDWFKEYKTCQNDIVYPWLEKWIRGVIAFKKNHYQEAMDFMDSAFETIRYSAGKHQERFLEDYLLVSLANPKAYKSFKQAYKWGTFMNHFGGLRTLFNLENDEDIKQFYQEKKVGFKAFEAMKNGMDMRTLSKLVFHWSYDVN